MLRILICDDNKFSRKRLENILTGRNHCADTAARLPEAIRKVSAYSYDLVILDIHIEGLEGLDPVWVLHSISPEIPVIAVSEDQSESLRFEIMKSPSVIAYFIYPDENTLMLEKIEEFSSCSSADK